MKHEIITLQDQQIIGMSLYPIPNGQWLKIHFEGGMAAF